MTIVRVGTTKKYADNWATVFGGAKLSKASKKVAAPTKSQAKPSKKAAPKKSKKK